MLSTLATKIKATVWERIEFVPAQAHLAMSSQMDSKDQEVFAIVSAWPLLRFIPKEEMEFEGYGYLLNA